MHHRKPIPGSKKRSTRDCGSARWIWSNAALTGFARTSNAFPTVAAKSKELDPEHRGISESAILDNQEARAYYEQHRSWRDSPRKRAKPVAGVSPASSGLVKPDRNEQRVRQRYLRMSKEALVVRLITAERTLAEQRERWLVQQDEMLTWRLRAEAAEVQLQQGKENTQRNKEE